MMSKDMTFKEALKILGIEKYEKRIFNSNSHGELSHCEQYFVMAKILGETDWFPEVFDLIVGFAEKEWKRPESIFQHAQRMVVDFLEQVKEHKIKD